MKTTTRARGAASVLTALGVAALLSGCGVGQAEIADRESGGGASADVLSDVTEVEVFRNIDDYPNVARFCVDDLAFAATSSAVSSAWAKSPGLLRVPEWDGRCGAQ